MANLTNTLKKFNRSSRALLTAAILSLAAASASAAAPAVLSEIPNDAKAVLVISNVKDLGTKLSNLAVRLNIPAPPDLAGYFTRSLGITKGFDDTGSAALAVLNTPNPDDAAGGGGGPPPMVILLPTNDPKAMMEPFQPGEPDKKGISEVTLPGDRAEKGYTAIVNKWIAIAQDKAALEAYMARKNNFTKTLTPESIKTFESNDIVLWADVPALTKGFDKLLEDKQQELTGMLDLMNLNNNQEPLTSALQKAAINEYFLAVKQYLRDATSAMLTLRMTDNGPTLGLVGSFRPDSPFGKFVAAQKPARPLDLAGLPNGDFLAAGAFAFDTKTMNDLASGVISRLLADEVIAKDPKVDKIKALADVYRRMLSLSSATSFVILQPAGANPPAGGSKNGIFNGAYLVDSPDPAKLYELQLESLKSPLVQDSMMGDIKHEIKVTPDAVTIKGVKLTKIQNTFTLREETPDKPLSEIAKKQNAMIQKMYGPDGITMYSGPVGKRLLVVLGSDAGILEASVAAAQANTSELANNASITASKDLVVPNTVAVLYLNSSKLLAAIQNMVAPNTPAVIAGGAGTPIVISAGVNNATLTTELHVPTTTITTIKDTWTKMMQLMMGGMTPPGNNNNEGGPMQP
jgi:hypothetical protein